MTRRPRHHEPGSSMLRVVGEPYDPGQRRAAGRIERQNPGWVIMYGPWTRRFWAYPQFFTPRGTILDAPSTAELLPLMRAAELAGPASAPGFGQRTIPRPQRGPWTPRS